MSANALPGNADTAAANVIANPYTIGNVTFTPALTVGSGTPYMTDDAGTSKHYIGNTLVTDSDQNVTKWIAGTVKIDSDAVANDSATIEQIYDMIGAQTGYKYVRVTITSDDDRVKLFQDTEPSGTVGTGTWLQGSASVAWEVQVDSLGETTEVLAAHNYYWAYNGADGGSADVSVSEITLTATVSFSQTAL